MTKENIIRKLTSRKFWMAVCGFVALIMVACGKTKGVTHYRLKLDGDSDSIVDVENLEDEFFGTGLRMGVVKNVLECIFDVIPKYIARTGNAVRLGSLVTLKAYATGTIDHANAEADPSRNYMEIRASELPSLRYRLKNARLVNANGYPRGIEKVVGGLHPTAGIVDAAHNISVFGYECSEIYVPVDASADAEVGVWLETLDGQRIVRCKVTTAGRQDLAVRIPPTDEPIAPGEYRIAVATRGTEDAPENAPLYTYRRKVKFVDSHRTAPDGAKPEERND